MLTLRQEKLIRTLATTKGRSESGLCLVEGEKNLAEAKDFLEYTFTPKDTIKFNQLVSTVTPQSIAGVARIPKWEKEDILSRPTIVVLDGVQDPGNIGTILRLALGFNASLVLVESADPANQKVVRASAGAFFKTPWLEIERDQALAFIKSLKREVYLLENNKKTTIVCSEKNLKKLPKEIIIVAGSEGQGIKLPLKGSSLEIAHDKNLESLNVAAALAIILGLRYSIL
ncbi:MAG: RNA methyltransferase [Candidatus Falkowbacteria bacterium]|nr:RNA methyltransferase [Candidatus Falkowbacteria bacterium]